MQHDDGTPLGWPNVGPKCVGVVMFISAYSWCFEQFLNSSKFKCNTAHFCVQHESAVRILVSSKGR
jgi:hypothetical protein